MSTNPLFSVTVADLAVERDGRRVLDGIDVTFTASSRVAVIGRNGVGKSTFFDALVGRVPPTRGSIRVTPTATTIGVLRQELDSGGAETVGALVRRATGVAAAEDALTLAAQALADDRPGAADAYDVALDRWGRLGVADFDHRLAGHLVDVGLEPQVLDLAPDALSGGQAARVGLLSVRLSSFDLTLLDEPTNGLDGAGLAELERWIAEHRGGLAVVSHDRAFLQRVATSVLELDEHHRTGTLYNGTWDDYERERRDARARAQDLHDRAVAERDRLRARAQRQREWVDRGVSRATKRPPDGDKNIRNRKLARADKLAAKATRTEQAAQRIDVSAAPWEGWDLRFEIATAERSATVAASWTRVVLERGDWRVGPFDLSVEWAERVALSGPNGSGKSTLLDAVLGRIRPTSGHARLGSGVIVGELDQRRSRLATSTTTLLRTVQDETGLAATDARSVLAKFGLDAADVERPASSLSPGERTRAQLATFQARQVNLLVLDEPTNHLDLPAIEQLEAALASYRGTLLVVTHDERLRKNLAVDRTVAVGSG